MSEAIPAGCDRSSARIRGEGKSAVGRAIALMPAKRLDAKLIHTHTFKLADYRRPFNTYMNGSMARSKSS